MTKDVRRGEGGSWEAGRNYMKPTLEIFTERGNIVRRYVYAEKEEMDPSVACG